MASDRRERLWLAGIVSVGFALRAIGTRFGLPHVYHPDEPIVVDRARHMIAAGTLRPNAARGFPEFCYPTLYIHLQALLLLIAGRFAPADALGAQGVLYQVGRLCTALFGAATIYVCYRAARALSSRESSAGIAAAAAMALCLGHVKHSQYITTDVPSTLFVALALAFAACALEQQRAEALARARERGLLLAAAASAGLGAAVKYNAGLAVLLPLGVWWISRERKVVTALQIAGAAALAFFVGMPWALFDPRAVIGGVRFQWALYNRRDRWRSAHPTDMRDVLAALALRLSDPITITTSLGGVAALWRDRERGGWRVVAALCALPLLNLVLLAGVRHIFDRHALPLLPFVALFAGLGWAEARRAIAARVKRVPARQLLVAALALAIFAWPAWRSLHLDWKRLQPDTRTVAARWINAHVTPGARICSDWYMPPLSSSRYRIRRVWSLCGRRLSDLRARCDVAIASSASYARYFRDDKPTTLSLIRRRCYDELFRGWPRLARFEAPGKPTIQVFRRP